MYDIVLAITFMGFGIGYEGYNDGKMYIGTYTPTREYGWVVGNGEFYLDSILEKTFVQY
jgi:TM2 domain-containing membrane protein YozV